MQRDFHYEATYVLARLAGYGREQAKRIATAAQFVDDAIKPLSVEHPEGSRFRLEPTGHAVGQLAELNNHDDQIRVWVPFHFLPGCQGPGLTQRLICWDDSPIANAVMDFARVQANKPFGLEALGVAVHAYADTFAHFGFSGISSRLNRVVADSIRPENAGEDLDIVKGLKSAAVLKNFRVIASEFAEMATGALGHGGVATCPDAPYLRWTYTYERGDLWGDGAKMDRASVGKSNPDMYLQACARIHWQLSLASQCDAVPFASVREGLRAIIATVGDSAARAARWRLALSSGALQIQEDIPPYEGEAWIASALQWKTLAPTEQVRTAPLYRFMQAAALHREFVLRELLPANGICLV